MKKIGVLICIFILSLHTVRAQNILLDNPYDKAIYDLTKAYCEPLVKTGAKRYFSAMQLQVMTSSLEETVDHDLNVILKAKPVADQSIAGLMGEFIHSLGFMKAMAECFPIEEERNNFVKSLFVAERLGAIINYVSFVRLVGWATKSPIGAKVLLYSSAFLSTVSVLATPGSVDLETRKKLMNEGMDTQVHQLELEIQNTKDPKQKVLLEKRLGILKLTNALKRSSKG